MLQKIKELHCNLLSDPKSGSPKSVLEFRMLLQFLQQVSDPHDIEFQFEVQQIDRSWLTRATFLSEIIALDDSAFDLADLFERETSMHSLLLPENVRAKPFLCAALAPLASFPEVTLNLLRKEVYSRPRQQHLLGPLFELEPALIVVGDAVNQTSRTLVTANRDKIDRIESSKRGGDNATRERSYPAPRWWAVVRFSDKVLEIPDRAADSLPRSVQALADRYAIKMEETRSTQETMEELECLLAA